MESPKLNIAPKLIKSVASIYTDINRVFMEYIDNAFDSAESLYDISTNSYSRPIVIRVEIFGSTHKDTIVKIKDNCLGIDDINRVTDSLGNSNKATNEFTNGQFGFGVYSFLAICNNITIATKVSGSNIDRTISLNSKMFDKVRIEDVEIGMILERIRLRNDGSSYTLIALSEFDKDKFRELSIENLKSEIEKHFEILLARENLSVSLIDQHSNIHLCRSFDYTVFEGAQYEKVIESLEYIHSKKYNTTRRIDISGKSVKILLKITDNKVLDRKPFFVLKNRRISEISNVKAFNSQSKSMIWSHPNVTGYVNISDLLEPTISRTDFRNTVQSKALFQTLLKIEPEIKRFVEENIRRIANNRFEKLGNILSKALRNIAIKDSVMGLNGLREGRGNISNNTCMGEDEIKLFNVCNIQSGIDESFDNEISEGAGENDDYSQEREKINPSKPNETIELPVKTKKIRRSDNKQDVSSGMNIKIDFENEPMKDLGNRLIRSLLSDNEIIIYKRHPEFEKRLDISMHGLPRISASLIIYLCCEIMIHYKDFANSDFKSDQDNRGLLNDFVESVHILEASLKQIENMNISDFN